MESVLFGIAASLVGLMASEGILELFKSITGNDLVDLTANRTYQVAGIFVFTLLVSTLTGIYPAFFLSGFKPAAVLKGDWTIRGNRPLRSALVVFQFTIAVILMILSMGVYRQLHFMAQHDWGFDHQGICVIENINRLGDKAEPFRQEISRQSGVASSCITASLPGGSTMYFKTYQTPAMAQPIPLKSFQIDADYLPTIKTRVIRGRNFDKTMPTDTAAVILNESAVKALGLGPDPLGAEVNKGAHVIGVVSDFNYESLRREIGPLTMQYSPKGYYVLARINAGSTPAFVQAARSIWQKMESEAPFTYYFLDESLAEMSAKESMLGKALLTFTGLAFLIACLGLTGLAAFMAGQRAREIGIRKALGASVPDITILLVRDFMKLTLLAILLAIPAAWWGLQKWLEGYAVRTDIPWWLVAAAGLTAMLIALAATGSQTIRLASASPTASLRT
jgi:putative ABC transport system permease protein